MSNGAASSVAGNWSEFSLSELCRQDRKIVEPRTEEARSRKYLSLEHVESQSGRILASNGAEDAGASTTFAFDSRHVLYGKLRPYLNKVALPDFSGRCTTELIPLLPNENLIRREFLAFILRRQELVAAAMQDKTGSRMPRADMDELLKLRTRVPSTIKQDVLLSCLREQLGEVERARVAVAAQLQATEALPAALLRGAFCSAEAESWQKTTIAEVASLVIDGPHVTPIYQASGVPFLTIRNIVKRRIDLSDVSFVSAADHGEFTRRGKAERGDILYTKDGTLGVPCVVNEDLDFSFFVSVALIKLQQHRAFPQFIAFALESPQVLKQVARLGEGAGLKHMVLKSIRALEVPLPPLETQQRVAAQLNAAFCEAQSSREQLAQKIAAVEKMPAALLRETFTGTI